ISTVNGDLTLLIERFDETLRKTLEILSSVALSKAGTEENVSKNSVKMGDKKQLVELLKTLEPALQKKKPKPCKDIMEKLNKFEWAEDIKSKVQELDRLVNKYKFKEAQEVVSKLY
ncbi:MAG: hypothetical protein HQK69_09660, partial [Desulfamplus sp.]|nr:hypothetical protein [Desulfamplus sp.]